MQSNIEVWQLSYLVKLIDGGHIDLNPSYQRQDVWLPRDQKRLLETISQGWPIPNLFIFEKKPDCLEMIDGKQRALAIYNFLKGNIANHEEMQYDDLSDVKKAAFSNYPLLVVRVTEILDTEKVEDYYALVNQTGLKLNRPELKKAEHFESDFMRMVQELSEHDKLKALNLFSGRKEIRLGHWELISEILAGFHYGVYDKKSKVDELYEMQVLSEEVKRELREKYEKLLTLLLEFDSLIPIKTTRFKKNADFYSLCIFYEKYSDVDRDDLLRSYKAFVEISPGIAPSNEKCLVLREYARSCVSQSNSKEARMRRELILTNLLANVENTPTDEQMEVLSYFELKDSKLVKGSKWLSLDPEALKENRPNDHYFGFSVSETKED